MIRLLFLRMRMYVFVVRLLEGDCNAKMEHDLFLSGNTDMFNIMGRHMST